MWHPVGLLLWHPVGVLLWQPVGVLLWHPVGVLLWHPGGVLLWHVVACVRALTSLPRFVLLIVSFAVQAGDEAAAAGAAVCPFKGIRAQRHQGWCRAILSESWVWRYPLT